VPIPADNGKEFAKHVERSQALDADFFLLGRIDFSIEAYMNYTNGLIRQFLPKKTDFTIITNEQVVRIT
jgi:IS30 family transposase